MHALSTQIELEHLYNTRDLGGMTALDGKKIRSRRLIRSGELFRLTPGGQQLLRDTYGLNTVVDLRTGVEQQRVPDPAMDGVSYHHIPILDEAAMGITQDRNVLSLENMVDFMRSSPISSTEYMCDVYRSMVAEAGPLSHFSDALRVIMENRGGAALWHCSAGKDRCGMTSVFVQLALGVSREDVIADYLSSQKHLQTHVDATVRAVQELSGDAHIAREAGILCGVDVQFITTALEYIEAQYASYEDFFRNALRIPDGLLESFRADCLE